MTSPTVRRRSDVIVVGAGVVGLSAAVAALDRGATVTLLERDSSAVGASVRNFGHLCITAQTGPALKYALASRPRWTSWGAAAGFEVLQAGTLVVARADDERAVLHDFAQQRGDQVQLVDPAQVKARLPMVGPQCGGAFLPIDLRLDPRVAVPALTAWLSERGATVHASTTVHEVHRGGVRTSRGDFEADQIVVAVGHDLDGLDPTAAGGAGLTRCSLHMLQVANPASAQRFEPAVLTGFSMLRYGGFGISPALGAVRDRLTGQHPAAIEASLNLMLTQRPDGDLVVGDTHAYGPVADPFRREAEDDLILTHAAELLGVAHLQVRTRWQGVYASAPQPFLVHTPQPGVRHVAVTTGIGMTTAPALADEVVDQLLT